MKTCLNCGKLTFNPKYCCRSCSAQDTNKKYPRLRTKKRCLDCGEKTKSCYHNRCEKHYIEYKTRTLETKTLKEYRERESVKNKHPSWVHAHIRGLARTKFRHLIKSPCANCGYSKHVELCHIKPISSFPDSALLIEVNSIQNVIQLCPNCHWEFDNKLLIL